MTSAADLLGVSLLALSNLLNGNADVSLKIALRIEKAFGIRMDTLMGMQTAYDDSHMFRGAGEIQVKAFAPAAV